MNRQFYMLSEFLVKEAPDFHLPALKRKAIVHGHCHHQNIMQMDNEKKVLDELGLDYNLLDSGCCGMAGAFGFEKEHYDVSIKVGERVLLPAVRQTGQDTLLVTDGFSCHEQIAQQTGRKALHMAELLQMALHQGNSGKAGQGEQPGPKEAPGHTADSHYASSLQPMPYANLQGKNGHDRQGMSKNASEKEATQSQSERSK